MEVDAVAPVTLLPDKGGITMPVGYQHDNIGLDGRICYAGGFVFHQPSTGTRFGTTTASPSGSSRRAPSASRRSTVSGPRRSSVQRGIRPRGHRVRRGLQGRRPRWRHHSVELLLDDPERFHLQQALRNLLQGRRASLRHRACPEVHTAQGLRKQGARTSCPTNLRARQDEPAQHGKGWASSR